MQNEPFVSLNLKSLDTKPCQDKLAKFRDLDSSTKHLLLAQRRPPPGLFRVCLTYVSVYRLIFNARKVFKRDYLSFILWCGVFRVFLAVFFNLGLKFV